MRERFRAFSQDELSLLNEILDEWIDVEKDTLNDDPPKRSDEYIVAGRVAQAIEDAGELQREINEEIARRVPKRPEQSSRTGDTQTSPDRVTDDEGRVSADPPALMRDKINTIREILMMLMADITDLEIATGNTIGHPD